MAVTRILAFLLYCFVSITPALCAASQTDVRLDKLFTRLLTPKDIAEAQQLEKLIWSIWKLSENESVTLLMQQGEAAMNAGDFESALEKFNEMVKLAPEFAEGWNKRATIFFLIENYRASLADINRTLALEPRHFGALAGLGLVWDALNEKMKALEAYRSALEIHPHLYGVKYRIEQLVKELEGQPI